MYKLADIFRGLQVGDKTILPFEQLHKAFPYAKSVKIKIRTKTIKGVGLEVERIE